VNNLIPVEPPEVFGHWRALERCPEPAPLRPDILNSTYPWVTPWFQATLDEFDLPRLFLLPVHDFGPFSQMTWQLPGAAEYYARHFDAGTYDPEHPYNASKIQRLLEWPGRHESRLIIVSGSRAGPLTILDGNHRAILLAHENRLIGAIVYVGLHPAIREFSWAQYSYLQLPWDSSDTD
jgi:hypothetical protein